MSKLYSVGVTIYATAYIVAESAAKAAAKAQAAFSSDEATVSHRTTFGEVPCSNAGFGRLVEEGPAVTLSPAMTFGGPDNDSKTFDPAGMECMFDPDGEEDESPEIPPGYTIEEVSQYDNGPPAWSVGYPGGVLGDDAYDDRRDAINEAVRHATRAKGDDFDANPDAYDAKAEAMKPNGDPLREGGQ